MGVVAFANVAVDRASLRRRFAFAIIGSMTLGFAPALAFDGSTSDPSEKIPKNFTDPSQALRAGLADLKVGDADASVAALTYAADSGQDLARWKLGEMYADGQGVQQNDLKAYHYFNQLVEDYDEDQPDRRNISAISQRIRRGRRLLSERHPQQRRAARPQASARIISIRSHDLRRSERAI